MNSNEEKKCGDVVDKICEVFNENSFSLFVKYCEQNKIHYVEQLNGFDFNKLDSVKGIGSRKKQKIIQRWNAYNKNDILLSNNVKNVLRISDVYKDVPRSQPFIDYCEANGFVYLEDLQDFDFMKVSQIEGIGIHTLENIKRIYMSYRNKTEKISLQAECFSEIHPSNQILPLDSVIVLGKYKKALEFLKEINVKTISELMVYPKAVLYKRSPSMYKKVVEIAAILREPVKEILKRMMHHIQTDKHYYILKSRSDGYTLQALGTQLNITRERVRQIETKMIQMVNYVIDALINVYRVDNADCNYINMRNLKNYFDTEEEIDIIKYVLIATRNDYYLRFADKVLVNGFTAQAVEDKLKKAAGKLIGNVEHFHNKMLAIDEKLSAYGIDFIDIEDFLNYLLMNGYSMIGDYVFRTNSSYGVLCKIIVEKYFQNGIKLYDDDDINRLRKLVAAEFDGFVLTDNNRSIAARISNFLVLCDRGTYTLPSKIQISYLLLSEIYEYIVNSENNTLIFNDIFAMFKDKLLAASNITNKYFLQGVLKYYFGDEFDFERDIMTKKGMQRENIKDQICDFIKRQHGPVNKKEIKKQFPGASEIVILNAQYSSPEILHWDYNYFIHTDCLRITSEDKEYLHQKLTAIFDRLGGYANEHLMYEDCWERKDFYRKNNIRNSTNLFYILNYLFGEQYAFKRPHIVRDTKRFTDLSTDTIIRTFLFDFEHIRYSEYVTFINSLKLSPGTSYAVFKHIEGELVRISDDEYVKASDFSISEQQRTQFLNALNALLDGVEFLPILKIQDYSNFPDIGYDWNAFLVETLISRYPNQIIKIISPTVEDRRYIKGILLRKSSPIHSFDQLVAMILKTENKQGLTLYQLESLLMQYGVIGRYLPKELYNSKYLYIEEDRFYVR